MIEILKYSVLATVLVSFDASKTVNAFAPGKWGFTTSGSPNTNARQKPVFSSMNDDELSRLIGKRSQIKRKKREELPSEDDFLESLSTDSLDLEKMPDFQTKRIARAPKPSKEEEKGKTEKQSEPVFVDYYADYVSMPRYLILFFLPEKLTYLFLSTG